MRTIAATHREELHRLDLELGDLEAHEDARRERLGDDVLGKPAPSHSGQDHVPLGGDVGHAPAHAALEHVERRCRGIVGAVAQDDLRVGAQERRGNGLLAGCERVIAVRDGEDAYGTEVDPLELRQADAEGGRDGDLRPLLTQRVRGACQALRRELDADRREALLQAAQDDHDRPHRRDRFDREPHHRLDLAAELAAEGAERLGVLDEGFGTLEEQPPGIGERGAILSAIEQRHAELVLQVAHQLAHRRLRLVQRVRRGAEPAFVGDGQERDELVEGHGGASIQPLVIESIETYHFDVLEFTATPARERRVDTMSKHRSSRHHGGEQRHRIRHGPALPRRGVAAADQCPQSEKLEAARRRLEGGRRVVASMESHEALHPLRHRDPGNLHSSTPWASDSALASPQRSLTALVRKELQ